MPVLPRIETSQSVFSNVSLQPQQIAGATPDAFGGITAEAAGKLAQGMQLGGDQVTQLADRQIAVQNETNANNGFYKSYFPASSDLTQKYLRLTGKDAVDQLPIYLAQMEQLRQQERDKLQDPRAQRIFDELSHRVNMFQIDGMQRHATQQNQVYQDQTSAGMVDAAGSLALQRWNDPNAFNDGLQSGIAEIRTHSLFRGEPIEWADKKVQDFTSGLYARRLDLMAASDPMRAADIFRNGETYTDQNGNSRHIDIQSQLDAAHRYEVERTLNITTNSHNAALDGSIAFANATGRTAGPLPQDFNAPGVKPYTQQQIDNIAAQVKKPSPYDDTFKAVAAKYNLDPTELKLRAVAESGLNPGAVSSQGATGIAQLMPDTAKALGVDPHNPEQAIDGMARLMVRAGSGMSGDQSAVDRAYYGGSTTATGPNTSQYAANLGAVRMALHGTPSSVALTADQLQAREGDVQDQARALAQARRPDDPVYADRVVAEAQKNYTRQLQAVRAADYSNMTQVLDAAVKGGIQSAGELTPELRQVYAKLTPRDILSVQQVFRENQRQASGEYTPSDPKVFNDTQTRINLPAGDPNRITDPSQITPLIAHGLSYSDSQKLITEMKELNSPEANPFLKQVNTVKQTAQKMLMSTMSTVTIQHPEAAQEAAYRFGYALDQQIAQMKKDGKDPRVLFDPTNPNYVLLPSRVASFLPSEADMVRRQAGAAPASGTTSNSAGTSAPQAPIPQRLPGETPAAYLARVGMH
ncbi:transglycosylase SLT domain-containing protein [Burkholderia sp. RF2-non_BP3]|uniref:transglycosylase SLT domain-containing protein n=1 Tax=Burkholderia sp. RF2-non_BP3 TaxID=1637844 RepID=UPI000756C44A|nr:transglycosylase SLT domain-containing protein [Burkholderia sp. RF2-non_BP3]KUY52374.1 hypothetical protein WS45_24965 [Burkholderia sp. RF2-non_BP3]